MKAVIFIHVLYLILIRTFMVKGIGKCESKVELRAVLLNCPAKDSGCDDDDPLSQAMIAEEAQILQGNPKSPENSKDDKDKSFPCSVKDCKRKLIITLKVKNSGKILCDDEYIVVDHVFDPVTGGKGRLLTPVVLKLQQEQMIQLYGLQFQKVVNSDPFEEQKETDKVCSVSSDSPTCGIATYDDKPIPFSEGFCCSCDPFVNAKRQLSPVSHGDSFLYRDSKLVSQINSRFVRDEKSSNAIVNPELVKLKSCESKPDSSNGKTPKTKNVENKDDGCSGKIPNFFFELDRKIICGRQDFLRELYKLEKEKKKEHAEAINNNSSSLNTEFSSDTGENSFDMSLKKNYLSSDKTKEEVPSVKSPESTTTDGRLDSEKLVVVGDSEPLANESPANNEAILGNLMRGLSSLEQTTTMEALLKKKISEIYDQVRSNQVTRGKRENPQETAMPKPEKKLTLEDKLEEFVKLKHHLTSRRKRLLDLPHKRLKKAEIRCRNAEECQAMLVTDFPGEDYVRAPPPKYFFAHDKYIVDPLGSSQLVGNSTCCSTDKINYEESGMADPVNCRSSLKSDEVRRLNERKNKRPAGIALVEPCERLQKIDIKSRSQDKLEKADKLSAKKDWVTHNIGGNIENTIRGKIKFQNYGLTPREKVSLRNDKRLKLAEEREEGETESEEKVREKGNLSEGDFNNPKSQKSPFNAKTLKNLLLKNENEKKSATPKIRNFFTANSREKKKFRSDFMKNRKITGKGDFEKDKLKKKKVEDNMEVDNNHDNDHDESENKKMEESKASSTDEKDISMKLTDVKKKNVNEESLIKNDEQNTETLTLNSQNKNEFGKEPGKFEQIDEELVDLKRKFMQAAPDTKSGSSRGRAHSLSHRMEEETDDVDFNMEIIRKHFPETSESRLYSPTADRYLNSRINIPQDRIETKVYDLNSKGAHLKNRPYPLLNLVSKTPQKYYLSENDRYKYPQDDYFIQDARNGPFVEMKSRHFHVKEPEKDQFSEPLAREYDSARTNVRFQPKYETYYYKKPAKHLYSLVGGKKDFNSQKTRQNYLTSRDNNKNKFYEFQYGGKDYPGIFFREYDDLPYKAKFKRPETVDEVPGDSIREKIRVRRAAGYTFEPARGFFSSELQDLSFEDFPGKSKKEKIVHELESCLPERKTRQSEDTKDWGGKITGWQFSRSKHEDSGFDSEPISGLRESITGRNNPLLSYGKEVAVSKIKAGRKSANGGKKSKVTNDKERLIQSYQNAPDYVLEEVETGLKGKRQTGDESEKEDSFGGGKNCEKDGIFGQSQDTAHCMRFGDMWYSMYVIKKPVVAQIVGVQMFDKHSLSDGTTQWRDLTKGKMVRIGTFLPKAEDELPTISITYMGGKTKKVENAIDPDNYLLLIPSHVTDPSKISFYPQFEGGPAEYLVVDSKDVSSGEDCNMIGTSFEAFARQPDRCSQRKGSCLKRQPVDLWREDMEARIRGKRGKYFVENFGTVPNSPIKTFTNFTGEFLALEYYGEYTSTIEIEIKADYNAIIRKGSNAQIPSVYIDSTYPKKTRIVLSVINIGLTSSYFRPRLGDCPPDLDPAWCPLEGPLVTIPPQHRHDFKLDLSGVLPPNKVHLTVQVLNQMNKKIAHRKIILKKNDRCVCAFHCKCNCIGSMVDGRTCHKLSLEDYKGAGYLGAFPFRGGAATSASESILGNFHLVILTASYVLLFLGVAKGILGLFFRRLGIAGTRVIVGPRKLCKYYECELQCCTVLYDECGFAVHPTTCLPVQIVPLWIEVNINFLFFFLYPLRGIWFLISSLPCCTAFCSDCDGCFRQDEDFDYDQKCCRPLLSKNPQPTCINYNLTTINTKKGKTEEFLPYLPYKGDDDPLEEDDTEFVLQEMKRYRKK